MVFQAIITDLDRTLLRDDKTVSDYTLAVLARARQRGIRLVVATARPEQDVGRLYPGLGFDGAVYHNGALVCHAGGIRTHHGIPSDEAARICRAILADHPGRRLAIEMDGTRYSNFDVTEIWPGSSYIPCDFTDVPQFVAEKILVPLDAGAAPDWGRYLGPQLYVQVAEGSLGMVMDKTAQKLLGVRELGEAMGFGLAQAAAFGDDLNDIGMIEACGVGVAVANALDEVKARADHVCLSNQQDGVARWVEENILRG